MQKMTLSCITQGHFSTFFDDVIIKNLGIVNRERPSHFNLLDFVHFNVRMLMNRRLKELRLGI